MKTFFVILALLLLLFAVGVGLGARGEKDGPVDPADHPLLEKLGGLLGARAAVDLATLDTSCRAGDLLAVAEGGACAAGIPAADTKVRTLKLGLTEGSRAELRFTPRGGASLQVDKPLGPDEELSLSIPAEGGDLLLTCLEAGDRGCRFERVE
jgi:hypothetical protein